LTGQSILRRDWREAEALVAVLNAPLILVRRDIEAPYANHSILPPNDLAEALDAAPNFVVLRKNGPLELFALRDTLAESEVTSNFLMINTQTPDLRLLALLPPNTALVSGEARAGVASVVQAPPLELWQAQGNTMVWHPPAPSGSAYRIAELDSKTVVPLDRARTFIEPSSKARVVYALDAAQNTLTVSETGRTAISDGDFARGLWGPVGDCHDLLKAQGEGGRP